jgi:hypothetical protein
MSTIGWTRAVTANRHEDLTWMYETGECARGAAERLGISFDQLDKWARRNGVSFWGQMLARNPRDWNDYAARRTA